MSNSR